MPSSITRREVHGAIRLAAPEINGWQHRVFCSFGELFRIVHFVGRKIRVVRKKENFIPFVMGTVLDTFLGKCPSIQKISKMVFGSLSIIRCGGDILELKRLGSRFSSCIKGKHYIVVKGDRLSDIKSRFSSRVFDQWRWFRVVYCLQLKEAFRVLGLIFRRFLLLGLHLSDVYAAYKESHVAEVFVYGKELWQEITSNRSKLVKYLKQTRNVNDWLLMQKKSSWTTHIFLNALLLPATLKEKLPDPSDVKRKIDQKVTHMAIKIDAVAERLLGSEAKYLIYKEGSSQDPNAVRFLIPPKRAIENKKESGYP